MLKNNIKYWQRHIALQANRSHHFSLKLIITTLKRYLNIQSVTRKTLYVFTYKQLLKRIFKNANAFSQTSLVKLEVIMKVTFYARLPSIVKG
jgi:hypothetical protein